MKNTLRINIHTKLIAFTLASGTLFAAIIYGLVIPIFEQEIRKERQAKLSAVVEGVTSLINFYEKGIRTHKYVTNPNIPKTRLQAQATVLNTLRQIRYEKDEHIFILDGNGTMIMHPLKAELVGNNMSTVAAPDGTFPFKEMTLQAQEKGHIFVKYTWLSKWSKSIYEPQIAFAKYFYPWNWVICSSVYTKDIDDSIHGISLKTIYYLIISAIIGLILIYLIARLITRPIVLLSHEVKNLKDHTNPNSIDQITIKSNDEIGDLATVFRDTLLELQEAMLQQKKNEENLRTTLNSIGDAVISTDTQGNVVNLNPIAEKLIGHTASEAIGHPLDNVFRIINAKTREPIDHPVRKVLNTGKIIGLANHTLLISKDGKEYQIADSGAPIKTPDGAIIGVVLVFRDVTDEYIMREKLQHTQKMDAIGQLAGGVAHDFNNMLGGIIGAAEMLQMEGDSLNETSKQFIQMIIKTSEKAAGLTAKLLAFGRKSKLITQSIDIHNILNDILAILERTIDKKIHITSENKALDSIIMGDEAAIQSAIMNLCINASAAITDTGEISIKTKNIILDQAYCDFSPFDIDPGEYIEIEVKDTGIGISRENITKIFEPFFTTKKQGEGTGLGLAAVYGTVQEHHGLINVYSERGIGTVFRISLPCSNNNEIKIKTPTIIKGSEHILLVDDEEMIRKTGKSMLEHMGYKVTTAQNGKEAIEIFKEQTNDIDLVLLDMVMPELDGKETFLKLKKYSKDCKIIISSGFTKNENLDELKEQGLQGFIQKPYRQAELSQLLAKILKNK